MKSELNFPNILVGAGGHAKVIFYTLQKINMEISFVVDPKVKNFLNIFNTINSLESLPIGIDEPINFFIAIGDIDLRKKMYHNINMTFKNPIFPAVISPDCVLYPECSIKEGVAILAGSVIGPNSTINKFSIINHSVTVDHDSSIGEFCNISPQVAIAGDVTIGHSTFIGIGASVSNGVKVISNSTIGAATFLDFDLIKPTKYLGKHRH